MYFVTCSHLLKKLHTLSLKKKKTIYSACMFKITPRFKAQTEGSLVLFTHKMHIESVKQRGFMLHVSGVTYSNVPALYDRRIPKSLQLGKVKEANVSTEVQDYDYYDDDFLFFYFCNVKYMVQLTHTHIHAHTQINMPSIYLYSLCESINTSHPI